METTETVTKKNEKEQGYVYMTCNINKEDDINNQLIYCSQLYGTFFAVSAKLKVKKGLLKSMRLTLLNFKGLYNIGMLRETKWAFEPSPEGATLTLHLKANAGKHGKNRQIRVNCKNLPIDKLKGLMVTRELHSMSKLTGDAHLKEGMFDSEFYQRDGSLIKELDRLDNMEGLTREDRCKTTYSNFV